MLAVDHGYFQGPTTGLERIDINILPLVQHADTLMLTRGILQSIVPSSVSQSMVLRVSGGTSILKELSNEEIAVDIEDSIRLNVCAMAYRAIQEGASGVDMGRNIFQSDSPVAMIQAVKAVVHDNETPEKAFELYTTIKNE